MNRLCPHFAKCHLPRFELDNHSGAHKERQLLLIPPLSEIGQLVDMALLGRTDSTAEL